MTHEDGYGYRPNLFVLNLVQPEDVLEKAYTHFADVVPQMHNWSGGQDPIGWCRTLPKESCVAIQAKAESEEDAQRIVAAFRERRD